MDSVYIKAALVQPPKIAGVQLRPFSLWHALMLLQLDNPVLSFGELPVNAGHIMQALLVCADGFDDKLKTLLHCTNSRRAQGRMAYRFAKYGPDAAGLDFLNYLAAYREAPEYWQGKDDKSSRILGPFRVAGTLLTHTSLSEARIWDMPFGLACCYQACIAEDNGAKLVDPEELAKADKAIEEFKIDGC